MKTPAASSTVKKLRFANTHGQPDPVDTPLDNPFQLESAGPPSGPTPSRPRTPAEKSLVLAQRLKESKEKKAQELNEFEERVRQGQAARTQNNSEVLQQNAGVLQQNNGVLKQNDRVLKNTETDALTDKELVAMKKAVIDEKYQAEEDVIKAEIEVEEEVAHAAYNAAIENSVAPKRLPVVPHRLAFHEDGYNSADENERIARDVPLLEGDAPVQDQAMLEADDDMEEPALEGNANAGDVQLLEGDAPVQDQAMLKADEDMEEPALEGNEGIAGDVPMLQGDAPVEGQGEVGAVFGPAERPGLFTRMAYGVGTAVGTVVAAPLRASAKLLGAKQAPPAALLDAVDEAVEDATLSGNGHDEERVNDDTEKATDADAAVLVCSIVLCF